MKAIQLLWLLFVFTLAPALFGTELYTSVAVEGDPDCLSASDSGGASASAQLLCYYPYRPNPDALLDSIGGAQATAGHGFLHSQVGFGNFANYPNGEATARFTSLMTILSEAGGPLFLNMRVRYFGNIQNHAESSGYASVDWQIDGSGSGTYVPEFDQPLGFDEIVVHSFSGALFAGQEFTISGTAMTFASDYHGWSEITAELLGFDVRDTAGNLVAANVVVVPEPATAGLVAFALIAAAVALRKRRNFPLCVRNARSAAGRRLDL